MNKYIILSREEVWRLDDNKPIKFYVDQIPYVLCTDECYKNIQNKNTDRTDGQDEPNYIKQMVIFNNRLNDLSERVKNIEKQIEVLEMNDKNQIKLLQDAIEAYENGEVLEAKDKAIEFINNITDFEAESEGV